MRTKHAWKLQRVRVKEVETSSEPGTTIEDIITPVGDAAQKVLHEGTKFVTAYILMDTVRKVAIAIAQK